MIPEIITDILPAKCWKNHDLNADIIITHAISARNTNPNFPYNYSSIRRIFQDYRISAHYGILRNGIIVNWVPEDKVAYHAGKSKFKDKKSLNFSAIGVEFFGMDDSAFDDRQYISGAKLYAWIMARRNIPSENVRFHSEVSDWKVRPDPKWDPGEYFDWIRFGGLVMDFYYTIKSKEETT